MKFFVELINELTTQNTNFRKVVFTTDRTQVVLMSIEPNDDIGQEIHEGADQILMIIEGEGLAMLDNQVFSLQPQSLVVVSAGTRHNIKNTGTRPLKLFTIYAPPQHSPDEIDETKKDSDHTY